MPLSGSLYTVMWPPDCLMKPNTMERPRPVPLPCSLVVKNGSKIRVRTSGRHADAGVADFDHHIVTCRDIGMHCGIGLIQVAIAASAISRDPPRGMASRALVARLAIAASNCARSICTGHTFGDIASSIDDVLAQGSHKQPDDRADHLVDIGTLGLQGLAARECQQSPREVRPAQGRIQSIAHQFVGHRVLGADFAQHIEIADDDCEQIVEVVRQTAGKLADRLHLLRLAQLLALFVRLMALGQVTDDADERLIAAVR